MERSVDVLVIGSGPCGLGVAWRVGQLRRTGAVKDSVLVVDSSDRVGGNAASVTTNEGFTFDYGGHILYPHDEYNGFVSLLGELVSEWYESAPVRGVWMDGRLIPYPVQQNIHRFRSDKMLFSLAGLLGVQLRQTMRSRRSGRTESDLDAYLRRRFGNGLTDIVLAPLNRKMWATEPRAIDSCWTSQRSGSGTQNVANSDLGLTIRSILTRRDNLGWSKAARVKYPLHGGTGAIWSSLAKHLEPGTVLLNARVTSIDAKHRVAKLTGGRHVRFRFIVSTMPLDLLLALLGGDYARSSVTAALHYAQAHVIGLGIRGDQPAVLRNVHSFHIPQGDIPCWRINVPSNFSPGNAPPGNYWSLLCEISRPRKEPFDAETAADAMIRKLFALGLLPRNSHVVSRWRARLEHGYPVPFLGRDAVLQRIQSELRKVGILSRGRFGGWKYEVSNQDHTFMQGVEAADHLLLARPERTYPYPERIN